MHRCSLRDSAKQSLTDPPGFLIRMNIFSDLIEQFFLFAQLEVERSFLLFSSDAHSHSFAWLPLARPSPQRSRHIRVVPTLNDVSNA